MWLPWRLVVPLASPKKSKGTGKRLGWKAAVVQGRVKPTSPARPVSQRKQCAKGVSSKIRWPNNNKPALRSCMKTPLRNKVQIPFSVWSWHVLSVWVLLWLSSTVHGLFMLFQSGSESACLVKRSSPGNERLLSLIHESHRANVKWMKFFRQSHR